MPEENLPPAGFEREEELKRRHDALLQEADTIAQELGMERPSPLAFRRIRDETVRPHDSDLAIPHAQADYAYSWVYRDPFLKFGNRFVHLYEAEGFEVVKEHMKEAKGMRLGAEGAVVNADCVLMRIRKDRQRIRQQKDLARRQAWQEGITNQLEELGDRKGVRVMRELPGHLASAMESSSGANMARRRMNRSRAQSILNSPALGRDIRAGTIPGMPAPGSGR